MNKLPSALGALIIGAPLVFFGVPLVAEQVLEIPSNVATDWDVGGVVGSDAGYALDALAIPYMKDKSVREIAHGGYWCGTPVGQYLSDHRKPSAGFLRARAKILEESIKSGSNIWVATGK